MKFFTWYLCGLFSTPILFVLAVVLCEGIALFFAWCQTKYLILKTRKEWDCENPYWREAFDAGVKWADDGKPPAKPNLTRLKGPN